MALMLLGLPFVVSAQNQKVTINVKDVDVQVVFKQIKEQTSLNFVYNADQLKVMKAVTLDVKDVTVDAALAKLFEGTAFEYKFEMQSIVIKKKVEQAENKKVILAACDTFRAAAVEQLQLWGERTGCQVVSAKHGADPASVAFDATQAALARGADFLLIDTAGRQHNQKGLMDELAKIRRSIEKVYPGAPHEVWLTVDASLGGNVVNQAREFTKTTGVTGLVLTKLDGTGKGGMVVALHQEFELPTFFIGFGEQPEDLQPFSAEYYAGALFGEESK